MTRGDFIANVDYFGELIAFCCDYGCTYCDDVFSDDSRDDYINEILVDMAADVSGWRNLRDILSDIPTGYDWYRRDDWGEWDTLDDDDFESYKNDVLEWADSAAVWEDDEDEEEALFDEDEDDFFVNEEPISVGELMTVCSSQLQSIGDKAKAEEAANDEAFDVFVAGCVTIMGV